MKAQYKTRDGIPNGHTKATTWKGQSSPSRTAKVSASLIRKYGIALRHYEAILEVQGGGCAICGITAEQEGRSLPVDHCHKTGKIRGILCNGCNSALGHFKERRDVMAKAIRYLDLHAGEYSLARDLGLPSYAAHQKFLRKADAPKRGSGKKRVKVTQAFTEEQRFSGSQHEDPSSSPGNGYSRSSVGNQGKRPFGEQAVTATDPRTGIT